LSSSVNSSHSNLILCLMKSNISTRSGFSRFRRSVYEPGCAAQPLARYRGGRHTEEASCETSHLRVETCIVSPPRCRRLRQRYVRLCQVQLNLVVSCVGDSCLGSCLYPTRHNFQHHARQLTGSFHAGPFRRERQLAVAASRWHCSAT